MTFPSCIFVLHELLIFLILSIKVSPSKNITVCKCSDSLKGYFYGFLDFRFSRLDFSRHKSLSVCKKYHRWFYPTFKVIENKMSLYLFWNCIKFTIRRQTHYKRPVSERNMGVRDLYSVSPRRDTSMKNWDKVFVATKWGANWGKKFEKKMK